MSLAAPSLPLARRPSDAPVREAIAGPAADHLVVRVGAERFALPLAAVEEAVEDPVVAAVPGLPAACLGVLAWRERRVPLYRPDRVTGVPVGAVGAALVLAAEGRVVALAVDEVLDALPIDLAALHRLPGLADPDGVLHGVLRSGDGLVAVLHAAAVAAVLAGDDA